MKKSNETLDLELIKLLCMLSILNKLEKPATKEYQDLNILKVLD